MTTYPTIAVVGASARATAFSLLRDDYSVVTADLFADADLRRACPAERVSNYPDDFVDWLARTECDRWLYTGALENYPDLVDQMASLKPLWGNPGCVLRAVRNPLLLQETILAAGLSFPETRTCDGQPPGTGDWLHKTGQGASGSGVSEFDPTTLPSGGYWQRYVPGLAASAVYLASTQTCKLLGITRQLVGEAWTGARKFQYAGTVAPWQLPEKVIAQVTRIGEVVAHDFQLDGWFGVDFVYAEQIVWPVEVNPRTTAAVEIIQRATEIQTPAGKAILYAKYPLTVSRAISDQLLHRAGPIERPQLADIPNAGMQITPGEPILTILTEGDSLAEVEAKLRQKVAQLEVELYGSMTE